MPDHWFLGRQTTFADLAAELSLSETRDFCRLVQQSFDDLDPEPGDRHPAELRLMLINLCGLAIDALHNRQPLTSCRCHSLAWETSRRLAQCVNADPRGIFRTFLTKTMPLMIEPHTSNAADRAASLVRTTPDRSWTIRELAARLRTSRVGLSRQFAATFGMRATEYLHLVRVSRAIALFRSTAKVESIAATLGYRSKKDFYGALKRWTGMTPTELRGLGNDESVWLERELRRRCLQSSGISRSAGAIASGAAPAPADRRASLRPAPLRQSAPPLRK